MLFAFKAISGYGNNAYVDDININSATGLVENLSLSGVNVSPSLTSGEVQVSFNGVDTKNVTVSIMDASGKLLEKLSGADMSADKAVLNLAKYDNGVYLLQVESNGMTSVNKVVLNK